MIFKINAERSVVRNGTVGHVDSILLYFPPSLGLDVSGLALTGEKREEYYSAGGKQIIVLKNKTLREIDEIFAGGLPRDGEVKRGTAGEYMIHAYEPRTEVPEVEEAMKRCARSRWCFWDRERALDHLAEVCVYKGII